MIELASQTPPSRIDWRPGASSSAVRPASVPPRRPRQEHAWPFLSRPSQRPVPPAGTPASRSDSGS